MQSNAEHHRHETLTKGARSAILLSCLAGFAMLTGIWVASVGKAAEDTHLISTAEAQPATPALAITLLSAQDIAAPRTLTSATGTLQRRDTLIDLVDRLGADRGDAYSAIRTLFENEYLDPRRLQPGLEVKASFETAGDEQRLAALSIDAAPDRKLLVSRTTDGEFVAAALDARLVPAHRRVATVIESTIYDAIRKNGASDQQVVDFASIFAYDVDFQREIHPGDEFEIVYEAWVDERGRPVKTGEAIFAELNGKTLQRSFYRHTPSDDGVADYFDPNGESATKFLMKTPINGARLSSGFGKRRHPISGYTRLHKGTDFAAPTGTPVYAAGHGTVERASRYGGYGNYVRIRHANGYKTAYAHLSRYGRGIKSGKRVRQGDVIGYVGSTGASTGPHLHYEVMIRGMHVNAMQLDLPTGRKLKGEMLDEFIKTRREIDAIRLAHGAKIEMASVEPDAAATP